MRIHATLTLVLIACLVGASSTSARAQVDLREGVASTGLCGLINEAYPTCPERWAVAANAGYAYLESMGSVPGAHHRLLGSLGGGVVPLPWLALALRLDGRIDRHPDDERGKDLTGTGDPRLFVRAGRDLKRGVSLGGEVVLWAPGNNAPSFEPSALTADFKALASWRPRKPFALLGHLGYRLDHSGNSAPDLRRLRQGDRIALSLSDFDAVLLGVGASLRVVERSELFAELSLDALVGQGAPPGKTSPLRASLGARYLMNPRLQGELALTAGFSSRPRFTFDAPLVPVEPRLSVTVGLRYGRLLHPPPAPVVEPPVEEPAVQAPPAPPPLADVRGRLLDEQGQPVPDVRVVLTVPPESALRETITTGEGTYSFSEVPVGDVTLEASAPGFESQQWLLAVQPALPAADRTLVRKSDIGTLRLLTRTFSSEPLSATITVRDARARKVGSGKSDERGRYEIELPPGRYTVMIAAPGYRPLRRQVRVERYGVAILNVDMRKQR